MIGSGVHAARRRGGLTLWDGRPLPVEPKAELERERERLVLVERRLPYDVLYLLNQFFHEMKTALSLDRCRTPNPGRGTAPTQADPAWASGNCSPAQALIEFDRR